MILIVLFVGLLVRILSKHTATKMRAWKKVGVIGLFLFAIFSISYPEFTNRIAQMMGIGRGADLLLYFLTVAFIGSTINQYMRNKELEQRVVTLARRIALIDADKK